MNIFNLPEFRHTLILALGSLTFGIIMTFSSPTINEISHKFNFSTTQRNLFTSIPSLTAILGPFMSDYIITKGGKRESIKITSILLAFSWILLLFAPYSIPSIPIIHRALGGIGIGSFSAIIPVMINDISPPQYKNILGTMHQFGIVIGCLLCNLFGIFLNYSELCFVFFFIPLLLFLLISKVPEKWNPTISSSSSLFSISNSKPLLIGLLFMGFQQFSGINAVISNLGALFPNNKAIPTFVASSECISCLICISVINKFGQKMAYAISSLGSSISLFIFSFTIPNEKNSGNITIAIFSAFLFLFFFCLGLGPVPWNIAPQLFEDNIKNKAVSFLSIANWFFSFLIIYSFGPISEFIGVNGTLKVNGVFMIFSTIFSIYGFQIKNEVSNLYSDENLFQEEEFSQFSQMFQQD